MQPAISTGRKTVSLPYPGEAGLPPAEAHSHLNSILLQRNVNAVFQPILDLSRNTYIGFEGLIRGPEGSPLRRPVSLFRAAVQFGLSLEIEMLCRQAVLEAFARIQLPGRLFLNVSPSVLTHPSFRNGQTLALMKQLGIGPERVTIEITENQPTDDIQAMRDALLHYRGMGFRIALDDLGEGFSSLRLWSELHPEYVKIDKHFINGVDSDPLKRQFLRSFQQIAEGSGCQIIAEGIESEKEWQAVKDSGIALGQGFFIARPSAAPARSPAPSAIPKPCKRTPQAVAHGRALTARSLLTRIDPAAPETGNGEIFLRFSQDPDLSCIPVVTHGRPAGLINRNSFMERYAQPFQRELLGSKPCALSMREQPLCVNKDTLLQEISLCLTETRQPADDFIITDDGYYLGVGKWLDLLRAITRMQIEAARHANPLTLLPGNVPINERIGQLLNAQAHFHACYCDLDNFKPFNDAYGYYHGDELIRATGRILTGICDPALDFIGHIGGDDFILLMQSADWEARCQSAVRSFAQAAGALADPEHLDKGGYESLDRLGRTLFYPLPTLSIGAYCVEPGASISHIEVADAASEAKKMAKRMPGGSLFIERRTPGI